MTINKENDIAEITRRWLSELELKGQRRSTINDVARLAGVSKKTVSRVINKSADVRESTRLKVETVVQAINFQPNVQARGLASRHAYLVGVIYDNPNPQYTVNMQQGILEGLKGSGYELVVHPCDRNQPDFVQEAKQFIERQKLRGVILTPSVSEDERMADMLRYIGCDYLRIASVKLDDAKHMMVSNDKFGGIAVANHLCELGHRRIAFVTGKKGFRSSEERQKGFESGLAEYGLALEAKYIAQGQYTFESGIEAGHQLLALRPMPTAIFAANDEMAAGVLQAMRIKQFRAPDNISIVGYDDFQIAKNVWPRLTTVHVPIASMGKLAAEHMLAMGTSNEPGPEITPWLIERESSGPPPK